MLTLKAIRKVLGLDRVSGCDILARIKGLEGPMTLQFMCTNCGESFCDKRNSHDWILHGDCPYCGRGTDSRIDVWPGGTLRVTKESKTKRGKEG